VIDQLLIKTQEHAVSLTLYFEELDTDGLEMTSVVSEVGKNGVVTVSVQSYSGTFLTNGSTEIISVGDAT
jgi:hypothetical protein